MRQLTGYKNQIRDILLSKLPMRQLTGPFPELFSQKISKLPMRQLTQRSPISNQILIF